MRTLLATAVRTGLPENPSFADLAKHPLAVWTELTLGLTREECKWRRARPMTLEAAAARLATDAGIPEELAREILANFLLLAYHTTDKLPEDGGRSLFAFLSLIHI